MLGETTWSEGRIAELERLWSEGLSTAEIGRRLAISKSAVVGKAHRLNLLGRPSPIQARLPEQKNPIGPTAPPRRRTSDPRVPRLPYPPGAIEAWASARDRAPMEAPSVRSPNPATNQLSASHTCCWPLGEPGSQLFRFCDYPVAANKPYCEAHCRAAYKPRRSPERGNIERLA
jgi:GcrA cell cycle regulator